MLVLNNRALHFKERISSSSLKSGAHLEELHLQERQIGIQIGIQLIPLLKTDGKHEGWQDIITLFLGKEAEGIYRRVGWGLL